MKKIFVLLLSVVLCCALSVGFIGCGETPENPPEVTSITTAEEFKGIIGSGKYELAGNIDFGGAEFTPISNFSGNLDGKNYTVKNFKITTSGTNAGLFSSLSGTVKDLKIEQATVNGTFQKAGLIAANFNGKLENVSASGNITASVNENEIYIGGLVGFANGGEISGCSFNGNVTGKTVSKSVYVGGISATGVDKIENCKVTGNVLADTYEYEDEGDIVIRDFNFGAYAGGIEAKHLSADSISACEVKANVTSDSVACSYAGGIVADNLGDISNCYYEGEVYGAAKTKGNPTNYVGGLVGIFENGNLSKSVATGKVENYTENLTEISKAFSTSCAGLVANFKTGSASNCISAISEVVTDIEGDRQPSSSRAYAWAICFEEWGAGSSASNFYFDKDVTAVTEIIGGVSTVKDFETYHYSADGTEKDTSEIYALSFLTGTLGFSSSVWNLSEGNLPTLK